MGYWNHFPVDGPRPSAPFYAPVESSQTISLKIQGVLTGLLFANLILQIVDVRFQSNSASSYGEVTKSQETRFLNSDSCEDQSSQGRDNSLTMSPPKLLSLPDEDDLIQPCNTSKRPPSCSASEQQSTSCVASSTSCEGSAKPKCRPFPYGQANPIDIVIEEPAEENFAAKVFDEDVQMIEYPRSNSDGSTSVPSGPWSNEASASSATSTSSKSNKADSIHNEPHYVEEGLTNLDPLDFLVNRKSSASVLQDLDSDDSPIETVAKSRTKLCKDIKAALQALQNGNSDSTPDDSANALQDLSLSEGYRSRGVRLLHTPLTARPLGCTKLLKRRQLELWRNYIDRIAPWLDVCGNKKYFQQSLPLMAKSADHLHYSVLALSARHIELRTPGSSFSESNTLYQDAVKLLSTEIHSLETAVVTSCMLLCVLEMMSSHPDSMVSLRACASLMDAADMNARSSGMRQALFWTFANMSLWNSTLGLQQDILPVKQFYPSDSLSTGVSYIRSLTWGEAYAKYAIFLASAVESVMTATTTAKGPTKAARWKALFELIEDWFNCRPEEMQPLMSYPSILDDYRHPFPMLLYGSPPAVVGNLLYHSASILLLENKPDDIEIAKSHKSILWHARQTCGIVAENQDHGSWISGIRPLWVAGKVMANDAEHQSIVDMLVKIERATGWRTAWYAESLKQHWGKI